MRTENAVSLPHLLAASAATGAAVRIVIQAVTVDQLNP